MVGDDSIWDDIKGHHTYFEMNANVYNDICLVVSTILKHMKVNGKDYPFILWKIKNMFETTNQISVCMYIYILYFIADFRS